MRIEDGERRGVSPPVGKSCRHALISELGFRISDLKVVVTSIFNFRRERLDHSVGRGDHVGFFFAVA